MDKLTGQKWEKVHSEADDVGNSKKGDEYYDGQQNIMASREECSYYSTKPQECLNNSHCGWCDSNNACVKGTRMGPIGSSCSKDNFRYFIPFPGWDPLKPQSKNQSVESSLDPNVSYH